MPENILVTIAEAARQRVEIAKEAVTPESLCRKAEALPKLNHPFYQALAKPDISFICECKQASPSKGQIVEHFPYVKIAEEYEAAGADAISVLTEPQWFKGGFDYLHEISQKVSIPCLCKDFTIDEYMIDQARLNGAAAVLLIVALLDEETLSRYLAKAEALGMDALVECHDENEVATAKRCHARIIGVNNRNLKNFSVDPHNCLRLREQVGHDCLFVAESGIKNAADVQALRQADVDAVLIGETMMLAADKTQKLKELKQ
ncbi:indole-3-glycerol phosphate synthase TrpC [Catenisphaera adipataccumulans]|uniref:Indole-3-glycerol phosphate synthase n=1 Tax=Catenisphaera adipataccumulans TaxID=700500 RepID=A0A7W8CVV2_9FIRM|nr:indole-3-glycerol phosphate synthase TrpC [Catenisphaera adipataccumulans]MBB5182533.1 indole-3-glycerol phosphate synthase [Catenisphaera adipataccumulans]